MMKGLFLTLMIMSFLMGCSMPPLPIYSLIQVQPRQIDNRLAIRMHLPDGRWAVLITAEGLKDPTVIQFEEDHIRWGMMEDKI
jgi:hypothetical protein